MKSKARVSSGNKRAPEAQARVAAVLAAAEQLFLKKGLEQTSLREIIASAGGSKATIRKYFGSKAGLFAEVVTAATARFVATVDWNGVGHQPDEALQNIGVTILRFYLRTDSLAAYRGVVGAGYLQPPMAKAFYEQGHAVIRDVLAAKLSRWSAQGLLGSQTGAAEADLFLHLLRSGLYEQTLIGIRKAVTPAGIEDSVARVVRVFLRGIEPEPRS